VCTAYLRGESTTILILLVLLVLVVALLGLRVKSGHRRKALEHRRERHASGRALVRYVQLNRQCSEVAAYQRLATFVKQHVPSDDSSSIARMVAHDRQNLLKITQSFLVHDPDAIDKI
jgi:Tfp pilus assembly protein PilV